MARKCSYNAKKLDRESNGVELSFKTSLDHSINVFTTRPDTLFGVTFIALAADHELVENCNEKIKNFAKELLSAQDNDEKSSSKKISKGIFTNFYAIHPITHKKIPIWIANYILAGYGTGAVMGVPAHDERDYNFAKKYNLEIIKVISEDGNDDDLYTGKGFLINSDQFNNLDNITASKSIASLITKMKVGKQVKNYKIRDWEYLGKDIGDVLYQ